MLYNNIIAKSISISTVEGLDYRSIIRCYNLCTLRRGNVKRTMVSLIIKTTLNIIISGNRPLKIALSALNCSWTKPIIALCVGVCRDRHYRYNH